MEKTIMPQKEKESAISEGKAVSVPATSGQHSVQPVPIGEPMILPCAIEWNGETFGPGPVTITTASMRRALERAVENSGYVQEEVP